MTRTRESLLRNVLLDTGPLVAIYCESDQHHPRCAEALKRIVPPMLTTWPVLTEAAWILRDEPAGLDRLFEPRNLFTVVHQDDTALSRIRTIAKRYRALKPQLADLSLVRVAEEQELVTIFTLDRRDFTVYRVNGRRLQLLPDLG